jgi:hypothetical protein
MSLITLKVVSLNFYPNETLGPGLEISFLQKMIFQDLALNFLRPDNHIKGTSGSSSAFYTATIGCIIKVEDQFNLTEVPYETICRNRSARKQQLPGNHRRK